MKVLHTADWHLGQRLVGRERREEHERFLGWLIECIREHQVDLLIVAGDIFDSTHPPQSTMQLYYDFLHDLSSIESCEALLVAGNHDSPAHLSAPKQLLKRFQIHIVGSASEDPGDDIVIVNANGKPQICLCAVPYLRERDVRSAVIGEGIVDRKERYRQGIAERYRSIRALSQTYSQQRIPIVATGHLTLQGSQKDEAKQQDMVLGHILTLKEEDLPKDFDYMALGHLHEAHSVGNEAIRYSGSPIPINFSEVEHVKEVTLLTFEEGRLTERESVPVPVTRYLYRFAGTLDGFDRWLQQVQVPSSELTPWLEVHLVDESYESDLTERVLFRADSSPFEVLKVLTSYSGHEGEAWQEGSVNLGDYHPRQVFAARCHSSGIDTEAPDGIALMQTFGELLAIHEDRRSEGEEAPS